MRLPISCVALAALCFAAPANAQLPLPSVSVMGGVSQWDLNGTGTAPFGAVRVSIPLVVVIAEGSLGFFRPKEDVGTRTYLIPEAQLQWQILPFIVRPYLGVGAGAFSAISGPDPHHTDLTLSASAGVRIGLPLLGWGLRGELRVRGVGTGFEGAAAEWTLGVSK